HPPPRPTLFPYTTLFRSQTEFAIHQSCRKVKTLNRALKWTSSARQLSIISLKNTRAALQYLLRKTFSPWPCLAINQDAETYCTRSEEHTSELQSRFDLVC